MKTPLIHIAGLVLLLVMATSCSSISSSTVQLSAEVGRRMAEMEQIHVRAVNFYFDSEQARIEDYLDNEWTPLFLKNFVALSGILEDVQSAGALGPSEKRALEETVRLYLLDDSEAEALTEELVVALNPSRRDELPVIREVLDSYVERAQLEQAARHVHGVLGSAEPAQLIMFFASAAHEQIETEKKKVLGPLENARTEALSEISQAYIDIMAAQHLITGRLEAARRVSEEQERMLKLADTGFGLDELRQKLGDLSSQVGDALDHARAIADTESNDPDEISQSLVEKLETLLGRNDDAE